jgi:hypothetical protein
MVTPMPANVVADPVGRPHRPRFARLSAALVTLIIAAWPAAAQEQTGRPSLSVGPPIRTIETASALSTEPLGAINGVRELADGRLLVNDGTRRRLLLMDSTLAVLQVVLDSLSEVANTYGTRPGALIPYRGDTTFFVDPAAFAIVVLDPTGQVTRTRSVWRAEDVPYYSNPLGSLGWPGVDGNGRVVYRIAAQPAPPAVRPPPGVPYFPTPPDSAFVVGVDLDTRRLDTLGVIRIPKTDMFMRRMANNSFSLESIVNPMPVTDDWAVLPDGRIAFVRGLDYRIEYLHPDGRWSSSEKLPYDWQRMTDENKQELVDSVAISLQRSALTNYTTAMIRWVNQYGRDYPQDFSVPVGYVPPAGFARDWYYPPDFTFPPNYVYACAPGETPAPAAPGALPPGVVLPPGSPVPPGLPGSAAASGPAPSAAPTCTPAPVVVAGGTVPAAPVLRIGMVMPASEMPDYRPPFGVSAVRADLDGNLWIRINLAQPIPGGPIYDVVNHEGELVDRLQLPTGYTLVGFGRDRVVYLSMRDAGGLKLARVRLR